MTGITCLAYICLNKHIETDINIFIYDKLVLMISIYNQCVNYLQIDVANEQFRKN